MDWHILLGVTPEARLGLSEAYSRVFRTGGATDIDRQIVLNDIMTFSGYFTVTTDREKLEFNEGKRAVGGLIFSMTVMPEAEREALYQAARLTSLEEQKYG